METMASPQLRGLGASSVNRRGPTWIASGQEYRSTTYGHLNLYWRDDLVLEGPEEECQQLAALWAIGPRDHATGRLRLLRARRLFPGDSC